MSDREAMKLRSANDLEAFYRLTGEGGMDAQAADELLHQHAEIEALKAENERLRGLLTGASKAVWMNYDGDLLDRIEAALKEMPR
jgi:hypothetical protein